jgi:hypothetical protein
MEGQDNTATTQQGEDIPAEVQIPTQVQQGGAQTPIVYTAGTYAATYQRPPTIQRTPSVPGNFRPAQFAFLPAPDFSTARQPSEDAEEEEEHVQGVPSIAPRIVNLGEPSPDSKPAATSQGFMRSMRFEAPMRPLDVARSMYLDYTTTQSIKFYNKGCEKLPGEAFNGKLLLTWLIQVQDKASMFTWTPILTIKGKLLTKQFSELTMEEVRAHAQKYQDKSSREAQNSEMLIQCLKASITRTVYNKVYLQMSKYIIYRKRTMEPIEDGVCFLKTIIDNYHSNTRSSTKQIRKQLAQLHYYMKNVAKGDVTKLCEHTRELTYELNAAGETTNDLLANLIEALKEAPDSNFQRWLGNQVDLWSMRKIDWKEDGSDLMEDAEIYYQEAINTHKWGRRANRQEVQYAFKAVDSETETEVEKDKPKEESYEETIKALTAQLQKYTTAYTASWSGINQKPNVDSKYAWKYISPKAGEPTMKRMNVEGQAKTYYWCPHHQQWTIHKPTECKRLKPSRGKKGSKEKKVIKRQNFKQKKQAYIQAKAAYQACMNGNSEDELGSSNSDKDEDSNKSITDYSSEGSNVS